MCRYGGLPTPRPPAQRVGDKVASELGVDVTAEYAKGACEALRLAKEYDVAFAVMKQRSPSCGSKVIYDGTFTGTKIPGQGLAVETLRHAGFTVFGEEDIDAAAEYLEKIEGQNN